MTFWTALSSELWEQKLFCLKFLFVNIIDLQAVFSTKEKIKTSGVGFEVVKF